MNRDDQIVRLPQPVRGEINRRLQNGQLAAEILQWLNTLPEVQALMAVEFGGQPLNETHLAAWQLGGCREWEAQQDALEAACLFGAQAAELAAAANGQLADHLALCLAARIALALREPPPVADEPARQLHWLSRLCADLVALRKGDHFAQWLRMEREKFEARLKTFKAEEAARKRKLRKPRTDFKNHHASPEMHAWVAERLKRL